MLKDAYPYYLANEAVFANQDLDVTDKYSGEVATRVAMADAATIDKAIDAADKAAGAMAKLAPYERQAILYHCVKRFEERYEELALALCIEAGKPIKDARGEVGRLIDTFARDHWSQDQLLAAAFAGYQKRDALLHDAAPRMDA